MNNMAWATIAALAEMMAFTNRIAQGEALATLSAIASALYDRLQPEGGNTVN